MFLAGEVTVVVIPFTSLIQNYIPKHFTFTPSFSYVTSHGDFENGMSMILSPSEWTIDS